jgi:hypothetical protein
MSTKIIKCIGPKTKKEIIKFREAYKKNLNKFNIGLILLIEIRDII